MNVRFIDTSIMTNLLEIPHKCSKVKETLEEFERIKKNDEKIVLPLATIIETGNHIAHIDEGYGDLRRSIAKKFVSFIEEFISKGEPRSYNACELTEDDLRYIIKDFPQNAAAKTGIGDLSIIRQYEIFKSKVPAIGKIMIWSYDDHLKSFSEDLTGVPRRRDR